MMIIGSDFIDNNASFTTSAKRNGPKIFVKAWAESGVDENTPAAIMFGGSGYVATALIGSIYAYVGVPEGTQSVGAGSWGWFQIRGPVTDVQGAATSFTGSVGHNVYWAGATGLGATSSANIGSPALGVGVLLEAASSSTTSNIYLTGVWATPI
uniref:Uncharacterized protein n=1 Tax=viral metagenome TaxID=1070528 RepID=A0A6H1ZV82_9ZZZZ